MAMPKVILVADDDADSVTIIGTHLKAHGFQVVTASDGQEALKKAKAERPDLMIVDLVLPRVDGWHVIQQVRSQEALRSVPIIVLSALLQEEGGKDQYQQADYLMPKPFDLDKLLAKIRELLKSP